MNAPDFWTDRSKNEEIIKEVNSLKKTISEINDQKEIILNNLELIELLKIEFDDEIKLMIENSIDDIDNNLSSLETLLLLMNRMISLMQFSKYILVLVVLRLMIGLLCFIECIFAILRNKDIKLKF